MRREQPLTCCGRVPIRRERNNETWLECSRCGLASPRFDLRGDFACYETTEAWNRKAAELRREDPAAAELPRRPAFLTFNAEELAGRLAELARWAQDHNAKVAADPRAEKVISSQPGRLEDIAREPIRPIPNGFDAEQTGRARRPRRP